jgi:hypothetical protein
MKATTLFEGMGTRLSPQEHEQTRTTHAWLSIGRPAIVAAALVWLAVPSVWAQQADGPPRDNAPRTHAGEFVRAAEGEFRMTVNGQNEHPHTVNDQTRYTINGANASLNELKQGDRINVTMTGRVVTAVEATR